MKQKIKESLQQAYKNLGIGESAFDGVAALGETIGITDENLALFVQGAESSLKAFQSEGDRIRASVKPNPKPTAEETKEMGFSKEDISNIVSEALAKQNEEIIKPLQTRLEKIQSEKITGEMIATVRAKMLASNAGKTHKNSLEDAFDIVMESRDFDDTWTAEQFETAVINRFNKRASVPYADVPAPIDGKDKQSQTIDWSAEIERKKEQGLIPTN